VRQTTDDPRRLILFAIAMLILAVALFWAAYLSRHALLLIYVSALFAVGFAPLVRLIERQKLLPVGTRRFPRWLAILVVYVAIIGSITLVGLMIVPPLVEQARAFWNQLPTMFDRAQAYLMSKGLLQRQITVQEAVRAAPGAAGGDVVGTAIQALLGFGGGLVGILTILILTFYFLVEADSWSDSFIRLFPLERRRAVAAASRAITVKVSAWLTGQLLLGAIIGASAALGLWLMNVPYFYVLALIAAIGELIPVVGPVLAAIPAVAVAFSVSTEKAIMVLIFFVIQQQVENHVLVPKVMERQVGVSAVTVIVALLIGGSLLGIVGAILAVPTAAIVQVLMQELLKEDDRPSAARR
jgi:predicted PurR-regulated permease PerM